MLWGVCLLHKLGLGVDRLRSLLGHGCLLLLELLLLLGCGCLCCCNCVHLLLLGSGGIVDANNSLLMRHCLLKANPLRILLNARCSNDLPRPIILHGGLLCLLLLSWLLLRRCGCWHGQSGHLLLGCCCTLNGCRLLLGSNHLLPRLLLRHLLCLGLLLSLLLPLLDTPLSILFLPFLLLLILRDALFDVALECAT